MEKQCTRCKEIKDYAEFTKRKRVPKRNRNSKSSVEAICKDCKSSKEKFKPGFKRCKKCSNIKSLDLFYKSKSGRFGVAGKCKDCDKERGVEYRTRPEVIARTLAYNQSPEGRAVQKKFRDNRNSQTQFRIRNTLSNKMRRVIKNQWMSPKTEKYLGCTIKEFMNHLESQFVEGMTFDNYGEWHLDHILPTSRFDFADDEQVRICSHYSNIRPMWAKANNYKRARIEKGTEQINLPI